MRKSTTLRTVILLQDEMVSGPCFFYSISASVPQRSVNPEKHLGITDEVV